jgi:hypothetical protein
MPTPELSVMAQGELPSGSVAAFTMGGRAIRAGAPRALAIP